MAERKTGFTAPLGEVGVEAFMHRHWQRRPLLVRQAIPEFETPLGRDALFTLAGKDGVESRLLSAFGGRWSLRRGPFTDGDLPSLTRARWTLLVQGVDLHVDAIHALLRRFDFLSRARLDDLMISFATDGGGVGPHLDSYDVFLIQAEGRRRWRIGPPPVGAARALVPDLPVKILQSFTPTEEWVLEPGDMLYLPPLWAHDGVAVGPCMTYSVGFRAPSRHEFLRDWLAECADTPGGRDPRFGDPGIEACTRPGQIPIGLDRKLREWALGWKPDARAMNRYIGRFLTEPKNSVWFEPPRRRSDPQVLFERLATQGVRADRKTRMAYRGRDFFINGEAFPGVCNLWLRQLADRRELTPEQCARIPVGSAALGHLCDWLNDGWLVCNTPALGKPP